MENQFQTLQNWTLDILEEIKRDIKVDHLSKNPYFYKNYFGNRPVNRLASEEIFSAYEKELLNGNEELAEWVVNRWVFKNMDLYRYFEEALSSINPDIQKIEILSMSQSEEMIAESATRFGWVKTFLFALLNGVVFPKEILVSLQEKANEEKLQAQKNGKAEAESLSYEKKIAALEREISRLNEKLKGAVKKYEKDTEALKNQIKAFQKRLSHG